MKKSYIQPKMQVVELKSRISLLTVSSVDVNPNNYMYEYEDDEDWVDL